MIKQNKKLDPLSQAEARKLLMASTSANVSSQSGGQAFQRVQ